jgi:preprotein translocase subunit SecE
MIDTQDTIEQAGSWIGRARKFIAEVRVELSRVTWPTRREVYATTIVVILTSMLFGIYLWVIDLGLTQVMDRVFKWLGTA